MNSTVKWFTLRIVVILVACSVAYYTLHNYISIPTNQQTPYTILTIGTITAIGLYITRFQYVNTPETTENKPPESRAIPSEQFKFEMLNNPKSALKPTTPNPTSPSSEGLRNPLIREVETHTLKKPIPKKKMSFDDVVKQKILESLSNAEVNINVTVERKNKEWNITKAKSKIKTRKQTKTQQKKVIGESRKRVA